MCRLAFVTSIRFVSNEEQPELGFHLWGFQHPVLDEDFGLAERIIAEALGGPATLPPIRFREVSPEGD